MGPTLYRALPDAPIDVFGPAHQGSVFRAVEAGYRVIGIVDGMFGNVPSVWHKEILYALSKRVTVFGAASMGAIRAAELWPFGMIGVGLAYRSFRRGVLKDDDEVCVVHAPEDCGFHPLSIAMLDFRITLRWLLRKGVRRHVVSEIVGALKHAHFSDRTLHNLRRIAIDRFGIEAGSSVADLVENNLLSPKRQDALRMINAVLNCNPDDVRRVTWRFPKTQHFARQFGRELVDVPKEKPYRKNHF